MYRFSLQSWERLKYPDLQSVHVFQIWTAVWQDKAECIPSSLTVTLSVVVTVFPILSSVICRTCKVNSNTNLSRNFVISLKKIIILHVMHIAARCGFHNVAQTKTDWKTPNRHHASAIRNNNVEFKTYL